MSSSSTSSEVARRRRPPRTGGGRSDRRRRPSRSMPVRHTPSTSAGAPRDLGTRRPGPVGRARRSPAACRMTSSARRGRTRTRKVSRWPAPAGSVDRLRADGRPAIEVVGVGAGAGRGPGHKRSRPEAVVPSCFGPGARRRRRVARANRARGGRRVGAVGVDGPAAGDLEVVIEGAAAGRADGGAQDPERAPGALHQGQHGLLVAPGLGRDQRVVGVVHDPTSRRCTRRSGTSRTRSRGSCRS